MTCQEGELASPLAISTSIDRVFLHLFKSSLIQVVSGHSNQSRRNTDGATGEIAFLLLYLHAQASPVHHKSAL